VEETKRLFERRVRDRADLSLNPLYWMEEASRAVKLRSKRQERTRLRRELAESKRRAMVLGLAVLIDLFLDRPIELGLSGATVL
jgi:hypothetical protein